MLILRVMLSSVSAVLMFLGSGAVYSQDYPNRVIRIVTTSAGGSNDIFARLIAQSIAGPLGQAVVVENKAALIAHETAAKAAPDGYTLEYAGASMLLAPLISKVSFDPVKDFAPITILSKSPNIVVVHPSLPVKSIKELIALAKAKPGELNYGSSGSPGTSLHLSAELFKSMTGVNIVKINYSGNIQALTGLRSGEVHVIFSGIGPAKPAVMAGQLRAIGITSAKPSALFPGLPPIAATLPGYEVATMDFMVAPAGTPAPIINRLNREIVRILYTPDVKEKYFVEGSEPTPSTPEELAAQIKSDMAFMSKAIKDSGIRTE